MWLQTGKAQQTRAKEEVEGAVTGLDCPVCTESPAGQAPVGRCGPQGRDCPDASQILPKRSCLEGWKHLHGVFMEQTVQNQEARKIHHYIIRKWNKEGKHVNNSHKSPEQSHFNHETWRAWSHVSLSQVSTFLALSFPLPLSQHRLWQDQKVLLSSGNLR
jgi:hypothetical protein